MPIGTTTRKAHVKRVFGVTKNGDELVENRDMWMDILRTDEFDYRDSDGQEYRFLVKWADADLKEYTQDYDNLANIEGRKTELGKGTDPELPYNPDPDEYIPFRVIKELTIKDSEQGQGVRYTFKNKNVTDEGAAIPTSREIYTIRRYHWDTLVDEQLNNKEDTSIVKDEDYVLKENTEDKGQYFDMEVIKNWSHTLYTDRKHKWTGQAEKVVLQNKDIYEQLFGKDINEMLSDGKNSAGDPTIAARMDPFQNILNIQWGGLAVVFGNKDEDAPDKPEDQ